LAGVDRPNTPSQLLKSCPDYEGCIRGWGQAQGFVVALVPPSGRMLELSWFHPSIESW